MEILIKEKDNNKFDTTIDSSTNSNHIIMLDDNSHFKITKVIKSKEEFILFSLRFLLQREKKYQY